MLYEAAFILLVRVQATVTDVALEDETDTVKSSSTKIDFQMLITYICKLLRHVLPSVIAVMGSLYSPVPALLTAATWME